MDSDEHKMTTNEWIMFNHQKKVDRVYEDNRYYCYCGHSVVIPPRGHRVLCSHCGFWVYKDKDKQKQNIQKIKKIERQKEKKRLKEEQELREKMKAIRMNYFRKRVRKAIKHETTIK